MIADVPNSTSYCSLSTPSRSRNKLVQWSKTWEMVFKKCNIKTKPAVSRHVLWTTNLLTPLKLVL